MPPAPHNGRARIRVAAAAAAAALALTGCQALEDVLDVLEEIEAEAPSTGAPQSPGTDAGAAEARQRLDAMPIAEPAPRGDYERDEFGSGWIDTDGNGCSTRNDILARDLEDVEFASDGCKVLSGTLHDPYTGKTIEFTSEDPQAVQIDHVVPLSLAWRMGADGWDRDTRVEFANDPGNLLASDGPANREKSDSGPGEWQPHEGFQCTYAVIYIDVLYRYDLPVSDQDHKGLSTMLDTCA
ncbi:MAG TPA: HNH endonuclease family protein [Thermobifida alba]|nr:HNH endonuclease family protein [Thermobifida alba]